jgi:hypothetical protein
MANTISFTSDMNSIQITDSNRNVIFSQSLSGFGAIIYLDSNNELTGQAALADLVGTPITKSLSGWQWSVSYDASTKTLSFIGEQDDITHVDQVDFSIDQNNGVQVKRSGSNLIFIAGAI